MPPGLDRSPSRGAATASVVPIPDGGYVSHILVEGANDTRLYATLTFSWLYVRSDGRSPQWKATIPPGTNPGTRSIYAADKAFSNVYLWMGDTIFHSSDHAASWQAVPPLPNRERPNAFAVTSSARPTIYCASSSGWIYSSSDDGRTWAALSAGPKGVWMIFVDPLHDEVLFAYGAGVDGATGLFKSANAGSSWDALAAAPTANGENSFVIDPTDSSKLYVGAYGGVSRSTDGGRSWVQSAKGFPQLFPAASAIAIDPIKPNVLMTVGYHIGDPADHRLLISADSGDTWTPLGNAPAVVNCIAFDPSNEGVIYVGTAFDGVVRSADGGQTWLPDDLNLANAPVGFMSSPRLGEHTVTVLDDGGVLIAGGDVLGGGSGSISWCERFDPETNQFSPTASMSVPRELHSATRLQDGRVLVTGGIHTYYIGADFLKSAEIYDPVRETWTAAADMQCVRIGGTSSLLPDGRVFFIGGETGSCANSGSTGELFDPTTNSFTIVAPLPVAQFVGSATVLLDGTVFVTLANADSGSVNAAVYDYRVNRWFLTQAALYGFYSPGAARLADGRVLVIENQFAEIFDPATRSFSPTGKPLVGLDGQQVIGLEDGRAYECCGSELGSSSFLAEIYDSANGTFAPAPQMTLPRGGAVAARLKDGRVLVVGGATDYAFLTPEIGAEVFMDVTGPVSPRRRHNPRLLPPRR